MAMGLEPMWTDLSDMLATCTDDQLLKWKEVAENPRGDNFGFITSLRQLVVHMYNKRAKDIISELYTAVNDEINSRKENINMDNKLEARVRRLERLVRRTKNESVVSLRDLAMALKRRIRRDDDLTVVPAANKIYITCGPDEENDDMVHGFVVRPEEDSLAVYRIYDNENDADWVCNVSEDDPDEAAAWVRERIINDINEYLSDYYYGSH